MWLLFALEHEQSVCLAREATAIEVQKDVTYGGFVRLFSFLSAYFFPLGVFILSSERKYAERKVINEINAYLCSAIITSENKKSNIMEEIIQTAGIAVASALGLIVIIVVIRAQVGIWQQEHRQKQKQYKNEVPLPSASALSS